MLNSKGSPGESPSGGQFDMIAEYERRVHAITNNIKPKKPKTPANPDDVSGPPLILKNDISRCPLVYKKIIDSFLGTLLSGSVSPCRAALMIDHDIPAHDDFQALLAELGTHIILSGESERFLWHMIEHPDIFQKRGFVLENPEIQAELMARIHVLEKNGQHSVANKLRDEFLARINI